MGLIYVDSSRVFEGLRNSRRIINSLDHQNISLLWLMWCVDVCCMFLWMRHTCGAWEMNGGRNCWERKDEREKDHHHHNHHQQWNHHRISIIRIRHEIKRMKRWFWSFEEFSDSAAKHEKKKKRKMTSRYELQQRKKEKESGRKGEFENRF